MDGTEWGQESSAVVSMCNEELGVWRWVGEGLRKTAGGLGRGSMNFAGGAMKDCRRGYEGLQEGL